MSLPVRRAFFGKLAGDTTLRGLLADPPDGYNNSIFHQQAPEGAPYPFVIFQKQSGVPTETLSDPAALDTDVWLVKAVDRSSSTDVADTIAARLLTLLSDASLSISGATGRYLRRDSDVEYPEVTDGVTYRHAGALWRLIFS